MKKSILWRESILRKKHTWYKFYLSVVILIIMTFTAGCGSAIPEMTQEQADEISLYAAGLLLKYDKNYGSRLVSMEELEAFIMEVALEDELPVEETPVEEPVIEDPQADATGMSPTDDTDIIPIEDSEPMLSEPLEQFLELPEGIFVQYQNFFVAEFYPDSQGAVTANAGKSLLIMNFRIVNQSQSDHMINILGKSARFRVTINGSTTRNVLYTMLPDDLTSYVGEIGVGEEVDVVLLIEEEAALTENVGSISLIMEYADRVSTILLQ